MNIVNAQIKPIKVCLVLKDRGWILEKMALRLSEQLLNWNVTSEIAFAPSSSADVNHWMYYNDLQGDFVGKNTLMITHVDRPVKLHVLKQRLKKADMGICMSRMALDQLISSGIPSQKLCYITPGHDGNIKPKRIVIGITSQIRKDGAKREYVLVQMAQTIRLDAFHFDILGPNWENVIPYFEAAGATVNYNTGSQKDNLEHLRLVRECLNRMDYYLYMGWDEGSMGLLDALAAGIPTIVTPQGFHLDINNGITYSFINSKQLCSIFEQLAEERQKRINSVSGLTWNAYAHKHALLWHSLVERKNEDINTLLHREDKYDITLPLLTKSDWQNSKISVKIKGNLTSFLNDFLLLCEYYLQSTWIFRLARIVKRLPLSLGKQ
jgi:hypothetical protein